VRTRKPLLIAHEPPYTSVWCSRCGNRAKADAVAWDEGGAVCGTCQEGPDTQKGDMVNMVEAMQYGKRRRNHARPSDTD